MRNLFHLALALAVLYAIPLAIIHWIVSHK